MILSITDEQGACSVVLTLLESVKSEDMAIRRATTSLLVTYCIQSKPSIIATFRTQLLGGLIRMLSSTDEFILSQSIEAIQSITKNLDTQEKLQIISDVSKDLRYTITDYRSSINKTSEAVGHLPAFSTNKGISPFLNLFKDALLCANLELKEKAAYGYKDVVENSTREALKPSVMTITGPLIRIVSDRLSNDIKVVVIDLLSILLNKVGIILKPFFPQIQTIFFRSLVSDDRAIRIQAAIALSCFASVYSRLDLLYTDIFSIYKSLSAEQANFKETLFFAIRLTVPLTKDKLTDSLQEQIMNLLVAEFYTNNEGVRICAASCLGELFAAFSTEHLEQVCSTFLFEDEPDEDISIKHFRTISLRVALKVAFEKLWLYSKEWSEQILQMVIYYIRCSKVPLMINGIKSAAYIIHHSINRELPIDNTLITLFAKVCLLHYWSMFVS